MKAMDMSEAAQRASSQEKMTAALRHPFILNMATFASRAAISWSSYRVISLILMNSDPEALN